MYIYLFGICPQCGRPEFNPWVEKISWRREWQPTPVFLSGEFHGQRSPASYSPWGCKEADTTEQLTLKQFPAHGTCSINMGRVNEHIVLPMFLTSSLPILGVALWDFTGYCLYARTSASPKFISLWACLPLTSLTMGSVSPFCPSSKSFQLKFCTSFKSHINSHPSSLLINTKNCRISLMEE